MSDQPTVSAAMAEVTAAPEMMPKVTDAADEIDAMAAAYEALRSLDPQARYRVTSWLNQRLNWEQADHDEEPF